jgi:hypothetical protein
MEAVVGDEEQKKILWWFIATLLGSVGLNQGINKYTPTVRSDPFTGTQGHSLETRVSNMYAEQYLLINRMDHMEKWATECRKRVELHLRHHPE